MIGDHMHLFYIWRGDLFIPTPDISTALCALCPFQIKMLHQGPFPTGVNVHVDFKIVSSQHFFVKKFYI